MASTTPARILGRFTHVCGKIRTYRACTGPCNVAYAQVSESLVPTKVSGSSLNWMPLMLCWIL
eukprot:COSAG02_NODE_25646_length_652_cov_2.794940_1_plen_62_part_10